MIPFALTVACAVGCPERGVDSDGDRVPDCVERRTGTDPHSPDTDQDGVADGREDANRDGVVDPGESDPRTPGLFPGSAPHIPEPLAFDLVRGLGARKGELEVNTLLIAPVGELPHWAPEVEWAFADGAAIELELPIHGTELEAIKVAGQLTLPSGRRRPSFIQGMQAIVETPLHGPPLELSALYLAGYRFSPILSLGWMVGARAQIQPDDPVAFLHNLSVFADADERVTVGLETNLAISPGGVEVLALPQLHLQLGRRFRIQLGVGVSWASGNNGTVVFAFRPILE
ncbi:MAG: hypothetical protein R6X02_03120 [Enhygromyxa sp.]